MGRESPEAFAANFATDPRSAGWTVEPAAGYGDAAIWAGNAIETRGPRWQSPRFPVEPSQYYRLTLRSKGRPRGMWAAVFFDAKGQQSNADHYSGLDAAADWTGHEFFFRARHDSAACQLWFHPLDASDDALAVSDVRVTPATREQVATWADRLCAELPPLTFTPPADRWSRLPRTMESLRSGRALRVVMLGDSIINDTSNSAWDVLVERAYRGARIEVVTSVRGGTGCPYYSQENRVQEYVIRHQPDLLIIGGISNGFDVESIRSVIRQVRQRISPEILVLSDPVGVHGDPRAWPLMIIEPGKKGDELRKCLAALGPYRTGLRQMAEEEKVEYFDVATIWETYIAHSGKPYDYYLRDPVHANERGRRILSRMLVDFFAPTSR